VILENPDRVSSYNGGLVPLEHPLALEAFEATKRVVESFGTLRGYVGVDMVLTSEKAFILEVNPRITTSFIGLRRVSDLNIAGSIVNAVLNGSLPQEAHTAGVACFSKVPVSRPIIFAWQEMCNMEELISPPFPLANEDISYGMLQSYGETTNEALQKMRDAKDHLHEVWLRGQHPW
jgi:predicted ATP-grasp superfamily ATP-dependent carboligase